MLGSSVTPAEPPEGHKARFMAKLAATPQGVEASASTGSQLSPVQLDAVVGTPLRLVEREAERERPAALASVQEERIVDLMEARARRQRSPLAPVLAVAAAAIILLMGAWLWSLSGALSEQESRRIAAEQKLDNFARTLNVPAGYRAFEISAQAPYSATGTVLFNPDTQDAYLLADRLEPLPPGKVYEFWMLPAEQGVTPLAAGVFTPEPGGVAKHTTVAPTKVGNFAGFAVTLEDAPGRGLARRTVGVSGQVPLG